MTDYTISCKLSNETVYACYRGRFWHWNGSIWKESRIMTHRFELARAADKNLTPQAFLTNGAEFAPLDEYEIDCAMLDALENAKPCKNAPIELVEEPPTPSAQCSDAATAAESQTAASPAAPEGSSPTTETADAASGSDAPGNATGKNAALSAGSGSSLSKSNPAAPTFDFGADDQTNALLLQDAQTFITGNMARIMAAKHAHALSLEWDRRRNEELQAQRQGLAAERSCLALHADVRAAEEAGLSYGKYMLLKNAGKQKARRCSEHQRACRVIVLSHYHQKSNTKQEETQVKLKATIRASLWYMAAMVTAIGALLVSSGIEHSTNGWEMLGWAAAALVLLAAALAMLGLGCCADKESRKGGKVHKAPADTVKPKSRRKAG